VSAARHSRRTVLCAFLLSVFAACTRPAPPPEHEHVSEELLDRERWEQEVRGILSDALETLRTFEVFAAFRVGRADPAQLAWDPPTTASWNEATHVARGLHGRAEQLFLQVSTSPVGAGTWRQRRELAEASQGLVELGNALAAYRSRVDFLGPGGDGSGAWDALDRAWAQWEVNAKRWGLGRAELIPCSS
jgi:hypothetical protein